MKSISLGSKEKHVAEFDYDAEGNVIQIEAGGTKIAPEYAGGLISKLQVTTPDGAILHELSYDYDGSGKCLKESGLLGDRTFKYDAAGRLVEVKEGDRYHLILEYAPNGNRQTMSLKDFPPPPDPNIGRDFKQPFHSNA